MVSNLACIRSLEEDGLRRRRWLKALAASGLVLHTLNARAAWPDRALRLIVPYTPGGFTDQVARLVQVDLQKDLGQTVLVDNRPGAGSLIGVDAVAKAPADGYTVAMVIPAFAANTSLYPKLPYDPRRDLRGVCLLAEAPLVAAVPVNAPFQDLPALVSYARAHPGKISYGSSGNGSGAHLSTELFQLQTGIRMVHVPYRGAAPAMADLMGGQIQLLLDAGSAVLNMANAGRLRLIGVASDQRLPFLPSTPTFREQGFSDFIASSWAGMIAPAAVPDGVVQGLASRLDRIVRSKALQPRLMAMGARPVGGTPPEFDDFLRVETRKWAEVIRRAGVTLDA